jgi:hypothetical protein
LRRALQIVAIVVVIGSGAAFLTGMNMVASAASEKSSSHPKGSKEQRAPVSRPSERVQFLHEVEAAAANIQPPALLAPRLGKWRP